MAKRETIYVAAVHKIAEWREHFDGAAVFPAEI